jgi:hypothetical protein
MKTNTQLIGENKDLRYKIEMMTNWMNSAKDVLRFCAMSDVGTYYQQQSAKEFLINNKKITWSRHNPDGTYTNEHKKWLVDSFGEESLKQILEEEEFLKSI